MQLQLDFPSIETALETFKNSLDYNRLRQYEKSNYPIEMIFNYCNGSLSRSQQAGTFQNLLGMEFNLFTADNLRKTGAEVEEEVHIGGTSIDVVAELIREIEVKQVLPNGSVMPIILPIGVHTFECKAHKKLNNRCIQQIRYARGRYKNCHVLVLADTFVERNINREIEKLGGNILRAGITKNKLMERFESL